MENRINILCRKYWRNKDKETAQIQMSVLLGTARILRKVLEIWGCLMQLDVQVNIQYTLYIVRYVNNNNNNNNM